MASVRAVTVLLIILLAASGAPAQAVQGDPQATQEVEAAWERLGNLKTYRIRTKMPFEKPAQEPQRPSQSDGAGVATSIISNILSGNWLGLFFDLLSLASARQERQQQQKEPDEASAVMEVVNPDRIRMIIQIGPMAVESVSVGRESRFRVTGVRGMSETWQCPKAPPSAVAPEPELAFTLQATRGAEVVIDGVKTQAYDVTQTMEMNGTKETMRYRLYLLADRGLPRRMESLEDGKVESTSDYYDYDAPIAIELPNCEAAR